MGSITSFGKDVLILMDLAGIFRCGDTSRQNISIQNQFNAPFEAAIGVSIALIVFWLIREQPVIFMSIFDSSGISRG